MHKCNGRDRLAVGVVVTRRCDIFVPVHELGAARTIISRVISIEIHFLVVVVAAAGPHLHSRRLQKPRMEC